jgi:hypothetical protein
MKVLNYIISIIDYFMKTNNVNLINYSADGKRFNIYLKIFNKYFQKIILKIITKQLYKNKNYIKFHLH